MFGGDLFYDLGVYIAMTLAMTMIGLAALDCKIGMGGIFCNKLLL